MGTCLPLPPSVPRRFGSGGALDTPPPSLLLGVLRLEPLIAGRPGERKRAHAREQPVLELGGFVGPLLDEHSDVLAELLEPAVRLVGVRFARAVRVAVGPAPQPDFDGAGGAVPQTALQLLLVDRVLDELTGDVANLLRRDGRPMAPPARPALGTGLGEIVRGVVGVRSQDGDSAPSFQPGVAASILNSVRPE